MHYILGNIKTLAVMHFSKHQEYYLAIYNGQAPLTGCLFRYFIQQGVAKIRISLRSVSHSYSVVVSLTYLLLCQFSTVKTHDHLQVRGRGLRLYCK